MNKNSATGTRSVLILLTVALVVQAGLVSVQTGRRLDTSFVRGWMLDTLAPVEMLIDRGMYGISYVWDGYIALVGLRGENERLKAELETLRTVNNRHQQAVLEAQRLQSLLGIQDSGIGRSVVARVIGRDPTRGSETITVDKGSSHGLKPDSAVMTADGIVGRVIHSSTFFSIVQLINDSQSAIGVLENATRRQAILRGTGGRDLELEYIDDDTDLKEGDRFVSSGLDRIYPKGLPVGVITSIGPRRGLFSAIQVRPSADLGRLEEVICVLDPPGNEDEAGPVQDPQVP